MTEKLPLRNDGTWLTMQLRNSSIREDTFIVTSSDFLCASVISRLEIFHDSAKK